LSLSLPPQTLSSSSIPIRPGPGRTCPSRSEARLARPAARPVAQLGTPARRRGPQSRGQRARPRERGVPRARPVTTLALWRSSLGPGAATEVGFAVPAARPSVELSLRSAWQLSSSSDGHGSCEVGPFGG
jgi:hypothetical protein